MSEKPIAYVTSSRHNHKSTAGEWSKAFQIRAMQRFLLWHIWCGAVCSLHGLIRGENMELGRDSDTGGQVRPQTWLLSIRSRGVVVQHRLKEK